MGVGGRIGGRISVRASPPHAPPPPPLSRPPPTPPAHAQYWPTLLPMIKSKQLDPSFVITHRLPLGEAARGYKMFNDKEDGCVKVLLKPGGARAEE